MTARRFALLAAEAGLPTLYQVVDARGGTVLPDQNISASSPEAAGRAAFGIDLVRSGRRGDLVARIYWQPPGAPRSMVRLYSRAAFSA